MRSVLIIVWEFPPGPGGIGQHAFSLAYALRKKGLEVDVITSGDYASEAEIQQFDTEHPELGIRRIVGPRPAKYATRVLSIISYVIRRKPSLIFLSGKSALWCALLTKPFLLGRSKVYGFVHGSEVYLKGWIARRFTHLSMRMVDELICVSNFTKSILESTVGGLRSVSVLPNGLTTALMPKNLPESVPSISEKGYPRLLTVGRISARKGQFRVIKALPYLRTVWPDVHYHIVGIDHAKQELISLARSLGVEKHFTIHGVFHTREELYKAYSSANVFVMLSENQSDGDVEGFGIAILEANYFGMPAIGARGCGIEDAVRDGFNGYIVDGNDASDIASAVQNCLIDESMRERAKDWAQKHDWDRLVGKILQRI